MADRGFTSVRLIQKLNDCGKKFVFRVPKNFSLEAMKFRNSGEVDKTITVTYSKRRTKTNRASKDLRLPYSFDIRLIKVILKSKEEILLTNLFEEEFTLDDYTNFMVCVGA